MLDTNICVYIINVRPEKVRQQLRQHRAGDIGISAVVLAELRYGAEKSQLPQRNHAAIDAFVAPLEIASFDEAAAQSYGEVRAFLEKKGTSIGAHDLMIAAHAKSLGVRLVTNNVREFSRVKHLNVENWAQ